MDLGAFMFGENKLVCKYVAENFGHVPHYRGVRFMRYERPTVCRHRGEQSAMFAKYCGQDVIYFHLLDDNNDDSIAAWKAQHQFLGSIVDQVDPCYIDYYFVAPITDTYKQVCAGIEDGEI